MKSNLALLLAFASASAFAVPQVGNVRTAINGRTVNVTYSLADPGEPGIVTFELLYRGEAENAVWTTETSGDINKLVDPGSHSFSFTVAEGCRAPQVGRTGVRLTAWATNAPPDYMVIDLVKSNVCWYVSTNALPAGGLANDIYRTDKLVMRRIPAANRTFSMGSPAAVHGSLGTENGHEVTLTQDFWAGVFEVTQRQYENVMGDNPSVWTAADDSPVRPFDRATFERFRGTGNWPTVKTVAANSFCGRLRAFTGIPTFDLPTDAQWEFACKAGRMMEQQNGAENDSNGGYLFGHVDAYAWTSHNSKIDGTVQPHRVGEKEPNDWGLYDTIGNVLEWVLDNYSGGDKAPVFDPVGPNQSTADGKRILRGGSYSTGMDKARSSTRSQYYYPSLALDYSTGAYGARVVCTFTPRHVPTVPVGEGVRIETDEETGFVTVGYDLASDAIVTADILTNGVSIGAENFLNLSGDVNRKVAAGTGRSFRWRPDRPGLDVAANKLSVKLTQWSEDAPPDYMALDLVVTNRALYYVSTNAIPGGIQHQRYKTGMILFRKIPAAGTTFRMGSVSGESGREADKEIPHYVTLTNDFYMAIFETTLKQHFHISGATPTSYRNPVTLTDCEFAAVNFDLASPTGIRGSSLGFSWPTNHNVDATSAIGKLRTFANDERFDLPTEAQWEFAFRAGSPEKYGAEGVSLDDVAWLFSNTPATSGYWHPTCVVGLKRPNGYGLYDMLGNAHEMCLDWYSDGETYSDGEPVTDPRGPDRTGNAVVFRGGDIRCGDYRYPTDQCRAAARQSGTLKSDTTSLASGYRLIRFIGPMPR